MSVAARRAARARRFWWLLICLPATAGAQALPEYDVGPLTGLLSNHSYLDDARLADNGRIETSLTTLIASHAIVEERADAALIEDGETTRVVLDARLRLAERFEVGVALPWVSNRAGRLDSLIDSWHDIFSLPEGSRDGRPRDQLEYRYERDGVSRLAFSQGAAGIGDLRAFAAMGFRQQSQRPSVLYFSLRLPTGDTERLTGSGGAIAGIQWSGARLGVGERGRGEWRYFLGVDYLSDPDLLADEARSFIVRTGGGANWQLSQRISLSAQATLRSATFDSPVEKLGEASLSLTFGGRIRLSESLTLGLAVGEDIKVNSAPDVSFNVGLNWRP